MRNNNQKNIDSLVSKILSETLEEKANNLVSRLKHKEVNELGGMDDGHPKFGKTNFSDMSSDEIADLLKNYDSEENDFDGDDSEEEINELGGMDDGHPRFGNKNFHKMSSEEIDDLLSNFGDDDFEDGVDEYSDEEEHEYNDDDFENELDENDSEMCECGSKMYEGVCNECGGSYGMMDEEEDFEDEEYNDDSKACEFHREHFGDDDERTQRFCKSLRESLKGGQKKLDKDKNGILNKRDFELMRKGKKTETKEGKPDFLDLDKDGDKKEPMKKAAKDAKNKGGKKESLKLSESELIDLIESIVKEDLKTTGGKPKGLAEYERSHNGSGKENADYIKSVTKKMKDYLKDGSNGEYSMEPKIFPAGNGELKKMDKKAFEISDEGQDFDYEIAGLQIPDYDEVQPNEEWVSDNLKGSSKTGNNSKWANAVETPANNKFNEFRKNRKLNKIKQQSYNKAAQPVFNEKPGQESGKGINIKLESTEKETKVLNEEFNKIQRLMGYNRKTQ